MSVEERSVGGSDSSAAPPGERFTRTVVRGATITGIGLLVSQGILIASYVLLARLAGPSVFGAFAAAWIFVGFGTFVAESGMSAALIQRRDRLEEAAATAVISTFVAGTGLSLLALALAPLIGLYFQSREIGFVAAALAGLLLLNAATVVPDALMRRRFSFRRRLVVDPLNALTYGVVGVIALSEGMGVWGLVVATYAAGAVRVLAVWTLNRWLPDLRKASVEMWIELARYGRHVVASQLLRQVNGIVSTALLGRFLGIAPLGEFRFGWSLATQVATPVSAASTYVLLPAFARIAHDESRFRDAFIRSLNLLAAMVLPISFLLLPLGEEIAVTLLGERWRGAGYVLAALCGLTAAMPMLGLASEALKAANRPDLLPRVSLLLAVSSIALMAVFLPLGATGVASGLSIAFIFVAGYSLRLVSTVLSLTGRAVIHSVAGPAAAAAGSALAVYLLSTLALASADGSTLAGVANLALESAAGLATYAGLLFLLARPTATELMLAVRTLAFRSASRDVEAGAAQR